MLMLHHFLLLLPPEDLVSIRCSLKEKKLGVVSNTVTPALTVAATALFKAAE